MPTATASKRRSITTATALASTSSAPRTMLQRTAAGTVLGTPAFLAPELASENQLFDGRADLYALGCVGFWLLTGRLLFEANDRASLLVHHSQTMPTPPSDLAEEPVPAALDAVILACLAKDPANRPSTADELWEQLRRGGDFWTVVRGPFRQHDLTRADVQRVIERALRDARGSYRAALPLLNLPATDYKRLLSFLQQHDCRSTLRRFRTVKVESSQPTAESLLM